MSQSTTPVAVHRTFDQLVVAKFEELDRENRWLRSQVQKLQTRLEHLESATNKA